MKGPLKVWPDIPTKYDSTDVHEELVRNIPETVHSLPMLYAAMCTIDLEAVIDIDKCSFKLKLLRMTAVVLGFVTYLNPGIMKIM